MTRLGDQGVGGVALGRSVEDIQVTAALVILGRMRLYVFAWFPMVAIAVANGVVREARYRRNLGELKVCQVSILSALVLLGLYMAWVIRRWRPRSGAQAK